MKRQRGQSAVEFALVAPFIILMILAMIYGGIMFMDYLNFNNYARTIAREVSVAKPGDREDIMDRYNGWSDSAGIYDVSILVDYDDLDNPEDVVVNVNFGRGSSKALFFFMPENFTIKYRMKLENTEDSSGDTGNTGNTSSTGNTGSTKTNKKPANTI